jgi:hypothetical protein
LVVRNEDWPRVLATLVANAKVVFLAVTHLTREAAAELRAVQEQGREEATMIILPGADDLNPGPNDVEQEESHHHPSAEVGSALRAVRSRLAVFGRTTSPGELLAIGSNCRSPTVERRHDAT